MLLHSFSECSKMFMSFCCSNNRISAVGALSLGLGLRVNQTLRILVVSASLMGEVPLYMSTQIPPLPRLSTPLAVEYTGSKSQIREGGPPGFLL